MGWHSQPPEGQATLVVSSRIPVLFRIVSALEGLLYAQFQVAVGKLAVGQETEERVRCLHWLWAVEVLWNARKAAGRGDRGPRMLAAGKGAGEETGSGAEGVALGMEPEDGLGEPSSGRVSVSEAKRTQGELLPETIAVKQEL